MQGDPPIPKVLEGPDSEARLARVRRQFRAASGPGGERWLARFGKGLLAVYWAGCLGVILIGVDRLYPQVRETLTPPAAVETWARPFPDCRAAHAAGVYNIPHGTRRYLAGQDGDGDGLACEPAPPRDPDLE